MPRTQLQLSCHSFSRKNEFYIVVFIYEYQEILRHTINICIFVSYYMKTKYHLESIVGKTYFPNSLIASLLLQRMHTKTKGFHHD